MPAQNPLKNIVFWTVTDPAGQNLDRFSDIDSGIDSDIIVRQRSGVGSSNMT